MDNEPETVVESEEEAKPDPEAAAEAEDAGDGGDSGDEASDDASDGDS
jgi:hypothetical protein